MFEVWNEIENDTRFIYKCAPYHFGHIRKSIYILQENDHLKIVNASWNGYDDDGAAAFGDVLANNKYLIELDISCCRIGPEGFGKVMKGLKSNDALEVLKVRHGYQKNLTTFDYNVHNNKKDKSTKSFLELETCRYPLP